MERVVQAKTTDYAFETVVELTADASTGWVFVEWRGDVSGTQNPVQVEVDGAKSVTAVFERRNYPLTVEVEGEGTVSERVVQAKTTDYAFETVVELTAEASTGWVFVEWRGDVSGTQNPVQVEVDGAKSVTAVFKELYPLTVEVEGEGVVSERVVQPKTTDYAFETVVELTAEASTGWVFVEWRGDVSGTQNPVQVEMNDAKSVTAVFKELYPLTVEVEGEGTVSERVVQAKTTDYAFETVVELTADASTGWVFCGVAG